MNNAGATPEPRRNHALLTSGITPENAGLLWLVTSRDYRRLRKITKITENYGKLPKITENYRRLRKITKITENYENYENYGKLGLIINFFNKFLFK
jgi:hypothetical protein